MIFFLKWILMVPVWLLAACIIPGAITMIYYWPVINGLPNLASNLSPGAISYVYFVAGMYGLVICMLANYIYVYYVEKLSGWWLHERTFSPSYPLGFLILLRAFKQSVQVRKRFIKCNLFLLLWPLLGHLLPGRGIFNISMQSVMWYAVFVLFTVFMTVATVIYFSQALRKQPEPATG